MRSDRKYQEYPATVCDQQESAQQIIKIVDEELTTVLGSDTAEIIKSPKIPTIIMMVGLQGAGKTTFAGKLALACSRP